MQRPYVILAAIAFDETGAVALHEAVRSARLQADAQLHLVHVVPTATHRSSHELIALDEQLVKAPAELQKRVDMLELAEPLRITAHIRVGSPSEGILKTARDLDADLIVVGTRARRGVERAVFGSVAERVLHDAKRSVLIAMPKDARSWPASDRVEPRCTDCVAAQRAAGSASVWCERHSHPRLEIHTYESSNVLTPAIIR